jgi:hypothetical protein
MVIRINALPEEANPVASEKVAIDGATTRSTTIQKLVEAGVPTASQEEAEAGVNSTKRMTPLTTKQSIASEVGVTVASADQGAKAANAVQKVASLAALKAIPDGKLASGDIMEMAWHTTIMDGGGGEFMVVPVGSNIYPVDDKGVVVTSDGGAFVFIRTELLRLGVIDLHWCGANGSSATVQSTQINDVLAVYEAMNATVMSGDVIADISPWLRIPQGTFRHAGLVYNPKCGFPTIRGDGPNSVLRGITIALYNDLSGEAGAQQFGHLENFKIYGALAQEYGIVLGHPTDFGGSDAGRWSGVREGRIRNIIATHCTKFGLFVVRDNHTRIESCVFNRNTLDGIMYIRGVDTEFSGVHCHLNGRHGVHIQPWAGNTSIGPYTGAGPGGLSWTDCNARYNGKGNFFATGGDPGTVISNTDTETGVADLDFLGETTIRVGKWWESYFTNCSWANIPTGSPSTVWLTLGISAIVQDTTNSNEIRITTTGPHFFQRGVQFDNSQMDIDGTGLSYDTMTPRAGNTYVVKEVYSTTQFSLNVQYSSAFSGSATLKRPRFDMVIKGQEKGYSPDNIFQIWFYGKNHNYVFVERCTEIDMSNSRMKIQVVAGANVLGLNRASLLGIGSSAATDDTYVPIFGNSTDKAVFSTGMRRFDIPWRNWGTGTPVTDANYGYVIERPVTGGGVRNDHMAGSARYFHAVHWRPDKVIFGRHDAQNDVYRGIQSKTNGDLEFVNEAGVKATWAASTGQFTLNERLLLPEAYTNSTSAALPNVVIESSGNLRRYVGDAIVEEGSNANGTWIKFASGTMICVSPEFTVDPNIAAGSIFRSNASTWTFPVAFVGSNPVVTPANVNNSTSHWGTARPTGLTAGEIAALAPSSATGRGVRATATGKWK